MKLSDTVLSLKHPLQFIFEDAKYVFNPFATDAFRGGMISFWSNLVKLKFLRKTDNNQKH
jgi:hypothetical protein